MRGCSTRVQLYSDSPSPNQGDAFYREWRVVHGMCMVSTSEHDRECAGAPPESNFSRILRARTKATRSIRSRALWIARAWYRRANTTGNARVLHESPTLLGFSEPEPRRRVL